MAKKTNKTDHVLNLLAGVKQPEQEEEKETGRTQPASVTPVPETGQPMQKISVIRTSSIEKDPVAEAIRGELEKQAEAMESGGPFEETEEEEKVSDEIPPMEPSPEALETVPESIQNVSEAGAASPERKQEPQQAGLSDTKRGETAAQANVQEPETNMPESQGGRTEGKQEAPEERGDAPETAENAPRVEKAAAETAQKAPKMEAPVREEKQEHKYVFYNVMETLIRDKVLDYMNKFGICTCDRCVTDTTALALNHVPPKYVVVDREAVSPLKNYYERAYVGEITVALSRACIVVGGNPYHDR